MTTTELLDEAEEVGAIEDCIRYNAARFEEEFGLLVNSSGGSARPPVKVAVGGMSLPDDSENEKQPCWLRRIRKTCTWVMICLIIPLSARYCVRVGFYLDDLKSADVMFDECVSCSPAVVKETASAFFDSFRCFFCSDPFAHMSNDFSDNEDLSREKVSSWGFIIALVVFVFFVVALRRWQSSCPVCEKKEWDVRIRKLFRESEMNFEWRLICMRHKCPFRRNSYFSKSAPGGRQ